MIDVLTLNYNDALTTISFVKSIEFFSCVKNILIVDNHSSDDSLERLLEIESGKIHVVQTEKNGGYGSGNNFGIRYLYNNYKSDLILLANPDVIVVEKTIKKLASFLKENENYALVAPIMTDANDVAQYNMAFMLPSVKQFLLSFEIILSRTFKSFYYKNIDANSQEYSDVDAVAGSLFMMNVPKMLQYGMFDENVFLYCEEIILGIKFKYNGLKIALLNTERYVHNHSVSISKSYCSNFKRNKLLNRSKLYVLKEYYNAGPITLFLAKILSLINLVESAAIDVLKGRN